MSKWTPDGPCAFQSPDGRYNIARAPQEGYPCTYTLVRLGTRKRDTYEDSEIIATETAVDDGDRKRAMDALLGWVK